MNMLENVLSMACSKWVRVKGDSMSPTLRDGDWVRVDRRAYRSGRAPARFDVVLLEHPLRVGFWEIKRIVGLQLEHVALEDGALIVDGVEVGDPMAQVSGGDGEWMLGAEEYVVLGDNRRRSTDSRDFGPIRRRHVVGKVVLPREGRSRG